MVLGVILNIICSIIILIMVSFISPLLQKKYENHSPFYSSPFECPPLLIFITMLTLSVLSLVPYIIVILTILTVICGISYFYGNKYFGDENESGR